MNRFAEILRELRVERGMAQTQLSDATGISQKAISSYELWQSYPTLPSIVVLVKFFGCPSGYLLGIED